MEKNNDKDIDRRGEKMSGKKAAFFDIDGTLWNFNNEIPESTVRAIRQMRANGNLAFLCSGRCRAYIQDPRLFEIGFDGVISGCGTMIEYAGENVFYKRLDNELVERTLHTMRRYGFRPILEGREYLYMDFEEFAEDKFGKKVKAEMGDHLRTIKGEWGRWEVSKMACATEDADREAGFAALSEDYDFMIHGEAVAEIVPKGFHKGTGITRVCELLGIDLADTFAFGDSANDLGMLRTAGVGVAMGNGTEEVKAAADYVTTPLMEDGIWNACRHFGLI
ncbi:MAG: Cof-type HAD-IIB family hydrolase [Eubacteriales bacterium]|nr:Cof-type HAD-IIB family hydrolase [Eubacteriales bacterium]